MGLSTEQQMLIEQRVTNEGPSEGTAYLLWFFLGVIAAHRFYLGRPGSALLMILAWCLFVVPGAIWWIVDAFMIPGMVRAKRDDIRQRMTLEALARAPAPPVAVAAAEVSPAA